MANSLEVRGPLLDQASSNTSPGFSPQHKLHGLTTKYILKRAVRDLFRTNHPPPQGRVGMTVAVWLEKDLRPMIEEVCSESAIKRDGWFSYPAVRKLMDDHFNNRRDNRKELWTLLSLMIWRGGAFGK